MLLIKDLFKTYKVKDREIPAVAGVSFSFPKQGMFFILGKSGCGKTSLLNAISGLDSYDSGDVIIDGHNMAQMTERELDALRNTDIGIIFQSYNLVPEMTVYQNIEAALKIQDWEGKTEEDIRERIHRMMEYIGLEGYEDRLVSRLSGGERQRIAIARALIKNPKIILADEPTGNLDAKTGAVVLDLLKKISQTRLVILVTHDAAAAEKYGDSVLNISDGRIVHAEAKSETASNRSFDVVISRKGSEDEGHKRLSAEEVAELAEKVVLTPGFKEAGITVRAVYPAASEMNEDHDPSGEEQKQAQDKVIPDREHVTSKRLKLKDQLYFSWLFMRRSKVRLAVTIALMSLTLLLLTAAAFITRYDDRRVLTRYFDRYQPENLTGSVDRSYVNILYQTRSSSLKSGPFYVDLSNELAKNTGHELIPILSEQDLLGDMETENYTGYSNVAMAGLTKENLDAFPVSEGHLPENNDEIAITDFLAHELHVEYGDKLDSTVGKVTVSGIIHTDYVAYDLIKKLRFEGGSDYTNHFLRYRYAVAAMRKEALDAYIDRMERLTLPMSLFFVSEYPRSYVESSESRSTFGSVELMQEQKLLMGRLPQKENEVLISENMAVRYGITEGRIKDGNARYYYVDIHAEDYNDCNTDALNMAEFFPDGVTVVGVCSEDMPVYADYLITDEKFKEIKTAYRDHYNFDRYLLNCLDINEYRDLVYHAAEKEYRFDEPAAYQIYEFKAMVTEMLPVLWIILAVVSMVTILNMISYIGASIRNNSKNIGILRALGVSKGDVSAIFAIESFVVYGISIMLSLAFSVAFMKYVNVLYQKDLTERVFDIIIWDHLTEFVLAAITFLVCVLAAYIPIRKMEKQKPIDIIRRNDK